MFAGRYNMCNIYFIQYAVPAMLMFFLFKLYTHKNTNYYFFFIFQVYGDDDDVGQ